MFYYFLIFSKAKENQQGGNTNLGVDGEKETAHLFSWLAALLSNYKEKCSPTERSRWNGTEVEATWQLSLGCLAEVGDAIRSVWRPFPGDWASLSCNAAVSFPVLGRTLHSRNRIDNTSALCVACARTSVWAASLEWGKGELLSGAYYPEWTAARHFWHSGPWLMKCLVRVCVFVFVFVCVCVWVIKCVGV